MADYRWFNWRMSVQLALATGNENLWILWPEWDYKRILRSNLGEKINKFLDQLVDRMGIS